MEKKVKKLHGSFGKNLTILRKKRGLTQYEAASLLGFTRSTYANYESGYTEANIDNLNKISKFFGISIDDLVNLPPKEYSYISNRMVADVEASYGFNPSSIHSSDPLMALDIDKCAACQKKQQVITVLLEQLQSLNKEMEVLKASLLARDRERDKDFAKSH